MTTLRQGIGPVTGLHWHFMSASWRTHKISSSAVASPSRRPLMIPSSVTSPLVLAFFVCLTSAGVAGIANLRRGIALVAFTPQCNLAAIRAGAVRLSA